MPVKPMERLKAAIAAGDLAVCRALMEADRELARNWRPIMDAALNVDLELIRLCLDLGADPNALSPSESGHRPLHRAIEPKKSVQPRGDRGAAVALLLDRGADVDAPGCWYRGPPLEAAARAADAGVAALLCDRGARRDIYAAALLRDPEQLDRELGRDPASAAAPGPSGAGALHLLCASKLESQNAVIMAERLLASGAAADAVAVMRHGKFPVIHFACYGGEADPALLRLLAAHGARPDDGLYEALWAGDLAAAEVLVGLGASPDSWSHVGNRPMLHEMIQWGRNTAALWLLERGADPNATDHAGWTALHFAASRGVKPAFLERLMAAGADPSRRNDSGQTPEALGGEAS